MTAEQIRLLDDLRMHLGMLAYGRHMLAEFDLGHLTDHAAVTHEFEDGP